MITTLDLILIPLIAMSIGWFTNYIAIKMLFYPRLPIRILGVTLHGVFPKRQKDLALKLGELFADQLNIQSKLEGTIREIMSKGETLEKLKTKMREIGTEFIAEEMPMLSAFVSPELFDTLATRFSKDLLAYLDTEFSPQNNLLCIVYNNWSYCQKFQIISTGDETLQDILALLVFYKCYCVSSI